MLYLFIMQTRTCVQSQVFAHSLFCAFEMFGWKLIYAVFATLVYARLIYKFFSYSERVWAKSCNENRTCIQFCSDDEWKYDKWEDFKKSPYSKLVPSDFFSIANSGKLPCENVKTVNSDFLKMVS